MKPFLFLKPMALVFLLGSALALAVSCDEDEKDSDLEGNGVEQLEIAVEIDHPDQITAAINITGATTVSGNAPSPTTAIGTPEILTNDISVKTSQDGEVDVALDYEGQNLEGFYFQIENAASYFDIPISSGSRLLEDVTLALDLTEAFEPGTFCGEICVYDEENRVSEPITVCIEILELGGENSAFLIGNWKLTATTTAAGETLDVGDEYEEINTYQCPNSNETVSYTETFRIDHIKAIFTTKGGASIDGQEYEKWLNWNDSSCDQLVYFEETSPIDLNGIWTYDDRTKRLDMVLQNNEDNEQEVVSFTIVRDGSNIELTFVNFSDADDEEDNELETLYFSPE